MSVAWVVVADASRARIFSAENPSGPLVEIQTLAHPEARLHEGDLVSDKSGRDRNSGSGSHDMGNQNEAKQEEAIRFASQVGQALECRRTNKQFKKPPGVAVCMDIGEHDFIVNNPFSDEFIQAVQDVVIIRAIEDDIQKFRIDRPAFAPQMTQ